LRIAIATHREPTIEVSAQSPAYDPLNSSTHSPTHPRTRSALIRKLLRTLILSHQTTKLIQYYYVSYRVWRDTRQWGMPPFAIGP
jgi:hypothetical protein